MLFRQCVNITMYIRVIGQILAQHLDTLLNSTGQGFLKMENYRTNQSPTFNKNQDHVPWIGEQWHIVMLLRHFPKNPDVWGYIAKK